MLTITERTKTGLYSAIAAKVAEKIDFFLSMQQLCVLGIAGGSVTDVVNMLLPYSPSFKGKGKIHVFWVDERVSNEKNYIPVLACFEKMQKSGVDIEWHPLQATTEQAIIVEAKKVFGVFSELKDDPSLDVLLLSTGGDCHVASLFPHGKKLKSDIFGYSLVLDAPKKPSGRITMTPRVILSARSCFLLFVGSKKEAFTNFHKKEVTSEQCPAKITLEIPDLTIGVFLD
jgi:6-phosphogluconolactonase/glucosamine-6-phosphate isomerase/deaminase